MRLLLLNPNTSVATTAAMLTVARDAAPPGVECEARTAPFGASLITNEPALRVAAAAVLAMAPALNREQLRGLVVAAFGDPGLEELRQVLTCPVTGIAEAGMAEAAEHGRFAVVTTTPGLVDSIERLVVRHGHAGRFRGVHLTEGDPAVTMADPAGLETALARACRAALDARAEALLIGGGPLATAARALAGRFPVPLVEPIPAAVRLAAQRAEPPRQPHHLTGAAPR